MMNRSKNIFLIGPMGAGKSTIGKYLTDLLKKKFYDTDQEIESRCGAAIDWIFDLEGEAGFRKREIEVIHDLTDLHGIVLATGGGSIISPENRTRLAARGVVVYLKVDLEEQYNRTFRDKKRPLLQVDDKRARLEELHKEREPLYESIADILIDTASGSVRSIAQQIMNKITESQA